MSEKDTPHQSPSMFAEQPANNKENTPRQDPDIKTPDKKTHHKKTPTPQNLSFEEALKKLETIVEKIEQGTVSLEESIALYEQGVGLKKHCEKWLQSAQERVEKIVAQDGNITRTPLDES